MIKVKSKLDKAVRHSTIDTVNFDRFIFTNSSRGLVLGKIHKLLDW